MEEEVAGHPAAVADVLPPHRLAGKGAPDFVRVARLTRLLGHRLSVTVAAGNESRLSEAGARRARRAPLRRCRASRRRAEPGWASVSARMRSGSSSKRARASS